MHRALSLEDILAEPLKEAAPVLIIFEDRRFVYPPDDDVV
jgi:hypothetical protein